ncbi:DUF3566 domain-containing protein [Nocardioides marmoriginsengisoli]|uniref:DUF3566 domain-containing protein n=2 Tax=Nocardioides marmoriginsengisoli TaxID=661483 RepID=A0A3N0CBN8_9ACTN|nr:DUF3566 domain-containing protein [Nocardioides marmoriginsengisoli]
MVKGPKVPAQPGTAGDDKVSLTSRFRRTEREGLQPAAGPGTPGAAEGAPRQVRQAKLRLVQVEPWSVMKAAFVLSVAIAIVTVVAVAIVWGVLGAAGLWDSVNSIVQDSIGDSKGAPFQIQDYLGTSRILGFTMLVAVADIVLITAIATLAAFLYNLAATLVGGIEVTFAEDK